ncbi:MAG: phosphate ABC transporter permease PstA [Rhodospirillales bacterium]|nr:phosphate ABC transporter permease PstA [Rhodospirillales bacterium]
MTVIEPKGPEVPAKRPRRAHAAELSAFGEPFLWAHGGALAIGIVLIIGFLVLVLWNGIATFWPRPVAVVTLEDGSLVAGEPSRTEPFRPGPELLSSLSETQRQTVAAADGWAERRLYRIGNYDLYNEDFRWIADYAVARVDYPPEMVFVERLEWGPFVGMVQALAVGGETRTAASLRPGELQSELAKAQDRWQRIRHIERSLIGAVNHEMERERLAVRRAILDHGAGSPAALAAQAAAERRMKPLEERYQALAAEARAIKDADAAVTITLADVGGRDKTMPLSQVVRIYAANDLSLIEKLGVYVSRWWEFLSEEPREANTEGGVFPAIFGTFAMTLLMVIVVAPFGVITALYLREYAKQGRLVSIVRISVNNLAGVPSIVYGVFGLGFFAYILGGSIDDLFYPERLPSPTFGTGGLLWASLTLALLTVPVVIVATEEALAAVPRSMREGSLACGASKWQTIRNIVLPRAMPGILTGLILAMARGAGEVAPLMLVGVVKLAPELPIDGYFPYVHLERSFMHLGFHIYDVGFQSRNSEAGKPMVFVTTLLLIGLVAAMNATAIVIRNRLKRKFAVGHF